MINNIFNPYRTPKIILHGITKLNYGFALPFFTVTFSGDGNWIYATSFEQSGKSNHKIIRVPKKTTEFIIEMEKVYPDIKKFLVNESLW